MAQHPITTYREQNGVTLEAFAAMLIPPVDKSTVSRWENGVKNIPPTRLAEVATITGANLIDLLPAPRPDIFEAPSEQEAAQ